MSDGDMGAMMGGVMGLGIGLIGLKMISNMVDDDDDNPRRRRRKKNKGINTSMPRINI
jgi:hypothetical protein